MERGPLLLFTDPGSGQPAGQGLALLPALPPSSARVACGCRLCAVLPASPPPPSQTPPCTVPHPELACRAYLQGIYMAFAIPCSCIHHAKATSWYPLLRAAPPPPQAAAKLAALRKAVSLANMALFNLWKASLEMDAEVNVVRALKVTPLQVCAYCVPVHADARVRGMCRHPRATKHACLLRACVRARASVQKCARTRASPCSRTAACTPAHMLEHRPATPVPSRPPPPAPTPALPLPLPLPPGHASEPSCKRTHSLTGRQSFPCRLPHTHMCTPACLTGFPPRPSRPACRALPAPRPRPPPPVRQCCRTCATS